MTAPLTDAELAAIRERRAAVLAALVNELSDSGDAAITRVRYAASSADVPALLDNTTHWRAECERLRAEISHLDRFAAGLLDKAERLREALRTEVEAAFREGFSEGCVAMGHSEKPFAQWPASDACKRLTALPGEDDGT